jgi:pimeloyl-ACP methyl ester carboxylesterase
MMQQKILPAPPGIYQSRRPSKSFFLKVRGLDYHIRTWGPEDAPAVVLLHGGQDGSATFQFMVDCFERDWRIVAPDWRGHGKSERAAQGYWFPDYLADLDAVLEQLFPAAAVPLVGHSLGGNVACVYAGLRPERVSRLVSLDGFGLPDRKPEEAPAQMRRWLTSWQTLRPHKPYAAVADMAARLQQANPRLPRDKALFLASELSTRLQDGSLVWAFDPRHRAPFGALNRKAEWAAYLAGVRAPTLFAGSGQPFPPSIAKEPDGIEGRVALVPGAAFQRIEGAGHNLHHDEPQTVAALVESFLTA